MKVIAISGVIGWDIEPKDIRASLEEAAGEDIDVQVSSPGGFVYDGLEIYNLIRNYQGNKQTHLMGIAASMASYIVLAGDRVIAEDNAIFMVHNVWGFAFGDHNDMRKAADVQEGMSKLLAKAYIRKSGKSAEDIRAMMDEDTYLFGDEILDAGFVDEIVPAGDGADDKESAVALAQIEMTKCKKVMEEKREKNQIEKAAAMLGNISKLGVAGDKAAPQAAVSQTREVQIMDLNQLKKEHPDLHAEVYKAGREAGISEERNRVTSIQKWADADTGNDKVSAIVKESIANGKTEAEVMPQLQVAMRVAPQNDGENPPDVNTSTTTTGGGAGGGYTAEEMAAAEKAGLSVEDLKKYGPKKEGGS